MNIFNDLLKKPVAMIAVIGVITFFVMSNIAVAASSCPKNAPSCSTQKNATSKN